MKAYAGVAAQSGFAIGPAHVVSTWDDLVAIAMLHMPVIVVAPYLEPRHLDRIERTRVYGFVVDRGSIVDPLYERLPDLKRPALLGCHGIYGDARNGDLVAIDGAEQAAVLRPEGNVLDHYRRKKGARAPIDPPEVRDVILRLGDNIRHVRYARGYRAPLDLPEDRGRLRAIAYRVARGEAPRAEDDEYVRQLLDPPPAPPTEELPPLPE